MKWKELAIFHILFCVTFIVSGLAVNLVQFILYVLLQRINRPLFRKVNYYLVYTIYAQLLFLIDWWGPATLSVHCAPGLLDRFATEHALILMNHHYELDWLYGWMIGDRAGVLGNCRVYGKKVLKYVPIVGWAWNMSDVIFLDRNWEKDKLNLSSKLNILLDYPTPVWILLFPEGTRYSVEKHKASQEFAASRGLPDLKHHLIPRTKGFSFTVSELDRSRISRLYDVTLVAGASPDSAPPTLTSILCGRCTDASMYIREYQLKDIPTSDEGSSEWLMNLFKEKDALKDSFLKTGCFSELSDFPKYPPIKRKSRPWSLAIAITLNSCVIIPLIYILLTGGLITRLVLMLMLGLTWIAMQRFINITKISKSSSYGAKKQPTSSGDEKATLTSDNNEKKKN
jgi:lysophosphatidic acid acyltransferase/lysophosphatidylinositol acyltransferase